MRTTSLFAASFALGKKNYEGDDWVYPGFVTYTADFLKLIFEEHGFFCKVIDWPHPSFQTWVIAKLRHFNNATFNNIENVTSSLKACEQDTREGIIDLFLEL